MLEPRCAYGDDGPMDSETAENISWRSARNANNALRMTTLTMLASNAYSMLVCPASSLNNF